MGDETILNNTLLPPLSGDILQCLTKSIRNREPLRNRVGCPLRGVTNPPNPADWNFAA